MYKIYIMSAIIALIAITGINKCKKSEVTEVGRCDSHGSCEVKLKDGTYSYAYRPEVGEMECSGK